MKVIIFLCWILWVVGYFSGMIVEKQKSVLVTILIAIIGGLITSIIATCFIGE